MLATKPEPISAPPDREVWSTAFTRRVDDAIRKLRRGWSAAELQQIHGGVVVNAAKEEIAKHG
jgi:hypothetical protein